MSRTAKPILCYVTERRAFATGDPTEAVLRKCREAIAAGVDWIQIREKDLPTCALLALARRAVDAARGSATRILVNDRLDVSLAASAAGVHLGGESLPVAEVVRWRQQGHAPTDFLIGASCHSSAEAVAAESAGADYLFFGPVFASPAKLPYGPPQGLERLGEVCRRVRSPVLAIGGIALDNAAECLRAGVAGLAAIRLFQESPDLAEVVRRLRTQP